MIGGCRENSVNITPDNQQFVLEGATPIPNQTTVSLWKGVNDEERPKKKSLSNLSSDIPDDLYKLLAKYTKKKKSSYAAFIGKRKEKKSDKKNKYKYRYFKLSPSQEAIEEAEGEKTFYFHIFVDPSDNEIYQVFAVLIPDTPKQLQAVKEWANKLNKSNVKSTKAKSSSDQNIMMSCGSEEGIIWVSECGCFAPGEITVCEEQFEPDDGGGGGGSTSCHYEPGGCEEDPDPNPDPPGGGGTSGSGEEPCLGNPLQQPRLASQLGASGIEGARMRVGQDAVRINLDGTKRDHRGVDIKVGHGEAIYSPYGGEVYAIGRSDKIGLYVIMKYEIGGETVNMLFAHLNNSSINEGATYPAGTIIGSAGISGNLGDAIKKGYAIQHVHIEVRTGEGWASGDMKDAEDYMTTKFDDSGSPISTTDC